MEIINLPTMISLGENVRSLESPATAAAIQITGTQPTKEITSEALGPRTPSVGYGTSSADPEIRPEMTIFAKAEEATANLNGPVTNIGSDDVQISLEMTTIAKAEEATANLNGPVTNIGSDDVQISLEMTTIAKVEEATANLNGPVTNIGSDDAQISLEMTTIAKAEEATANLRTSTTDLSAQAGVSSSQESENTTGSAPGQDSLDPRENGLGKWLGYHH